MSNEQSIKKIGKYKKCRKLDSGQVFNLMSPYKNKMKVLSFFFKKKLVLQSLTVFLNLILMMYMQYKFSKFVML